MPGILRAEPAPGNHRIGYLNPADEKDVGWIVMKRALADLGYLASVRVDGSA